MEIISKMLVHNSLKVKSHLLSPSPALVMGILNVTDDSFYDGGRYTNDAAVLRRAEQILSEGAAIIDVGAVSTKPGAADISVEEEWKRLEKPLELIAKNFPDAVVSVDTWRADIAQRSVEAGAAIINDVSGGTFDERMAALLLVQAVPPAISSPSATKATFSVPSLVYSKVIPSTLMCSMYCLSIAGKERSQYGAAMTI